MTAYNHSSVHHLNVIWPQQHQSFLNRDGLPPFQAPCNKVNCVNISEHRAYRQNNWHSGIQLGASFPLHLYSQTIWGFWVWKRWWVLCSDFSGRIPKMQVTHPLSNRNLVEETSRSQTFGSRGRGMRVKDLTLLQHLLNRWQKEDDAVLSAGAALSSEQTHFCTLCWSNRGQDIKHWLIKNAS